MLLTAPAAALVTASQLKLQQDIGEVRTPLPG